MPANATEDARRKDLIRRRATIKSKLTTFKNLLGKQDEEPNLNLLKVHKDKLESVFAALQEYTSELQELDPEVDHFAEQEAMELEYFELLAKVLDFEDKVAQGASNVGASVSSLSTQQPVVHTTLARLPEQALPKFDGRYEGWLSFQDDFQSTIGRRQGLSDTDKLKYLRSCLSGEPERLVRQFETTDDGYRSAWSLLKKTFEDKGRIRERHVTEIFNVPAMQRESAQDLSELINTLELHCSALNSLSEDTFSTVMLVLTLSKIDKATRKQWRLSLKENELPTYKQLISFLRRIVISTDEPLINFKSDKSSGQGKARNDSQNSHNGKNQRQMRSLVTTTTTECAICKNHHQLFQCSEFKGLSPKERYQAATRASLCINCLRPGHGVKQCTSTFSCKSCHKKHHTMLHFAESSPSPSEPGTSGQARSTQA